MSEKKNPEAEEKRKSLLYSPKNGYDRVTPEELEDCGEFAGTYKLFLDAGKTEREAAAAAAELAARHGFKPFKRGSGLQAGDRIIVNNRNMH